RRLAGDVSCAQVPRARRTELQTPKDRQELNLRRSALEADALTVCMLLRWGRATCLAVERKSLAGQLLASSKSEQKDFPFRDQKCLYALEERARSTQYASSLFSNRSDNKWLIANGLSVNPFAISHLL